MENNLIGSQIVKFRKAAGMTQEELGRSVGVSTQAVSRWECGGTPDVTLLPAIADRLGVTVDALFGRETAEKLDLHEAVQKWIRSLPQEQIFDQLNRLVWSGITAVPSGYLPALMPFPESCYQLNMGGKYSNLLTRSVLQLDNGFYFGVVGKDFSFSTLCPRPEAGYEAYLASDDTIRSLLALLGQPGCLEIMTNMLHKDTRYYSAALLAKELSIEKETVSELLGRLKETGLISEMEVELAEGTERVYAFSETNGCALLIFLYLARCMEDPHGLYYVNLSFREKPLL